MTQTIIWTIAILTLLGVVLAVVLYLVAKKFKVEEDPRIDEVEKVLPGANCGGCGHAGCRAFAQSCVEAPNLDNNFCPVGGNDVMQKVASVLGLEVAAKEPMVAVVRCNGTCEMRPRTNEYGGYNSCRVKAALYSGDTGCAFGCLGCGDCVAACQFGAMSIGPGGTAVVDPDKCTACMACAAACPRHLITSVPVSKKVHVGCANQDKGKAAMSVCSTSCIGCGLCQKECKKDAIHVVNGVAVIDYDKCVGCKLCTKVCPRDAILPAATAEEKEKYKAIKKAPAEKAKAAAEAKAAETAGK